MARVCVKRVSPWGFHAQSFIHLNQYCGETACGGGHPQWLLSFSEQTSLWRYCVRIGPRMRGASAPEAEGHGNVNAVNTAGSRFTDRCYVHGYVGNRAGLGAGGRFGGGDIDPAPPTRRRGWRRRCGVAQRATVCTNTYNVLNVARNVSRSERQRIFRPSGRFRPRARPRVNGWCVKPRSTPASFR